MVPAPLLYNNHLAQHHKKLTPLWPTKGTLIFIHYTQPLSPTFNSKKPSRAIKAGSPLLKDALGTGVSVSLKRKQSEYESALSPESKRKKIGDTVLRKA